MILRSVLCFNLPLCWFLKMAFTLLINACLSTIPSSARKKPKEGIKQNILRSKHQKARQEIMVGN